MFIILPLYVDVPQERYPFANWLIIAVTIGVFVLQVRDFSRYEPDARRYIPSPDQEAPAQQQRTEAAIEPPEGPSVPGITGELMLDGWKLKGLLGHMWLHGGLFHLLGNMWFLWLFGNAVCAKIGNLRYLALYVLLGVAAGGAHLLFSSGSAVGASGAINGVVGMYLVLFFENEITCGFFFWFIFFILRRFAVSSCWIILFWLFWDALGAFVWSGDSNVAYFAHLGGFGAGFGIMLAMCHVGWIRMERYEKSLVQWWQQRRRRRDVTGVLRKAPTQPRAVAPAAERKLNRPSPMIDQEPSVSTRVALDRRAIRVTCRCGNALSVSWQYGGKKILCPRCGRSIEIPGAPGPVPQAASMLIDATRAQDSQARRHIRFTCVCGRKLKVSARHAGRSGKCPHCGAKVTVPRDNGR